MENWYQNIFIKISLQILPQSFLEECLQDGVGLDDTYEIGPM